MKDSHTRSLVKGITWRITAMIDTVTIAFLITGDVSTAMKIGSIEILTKVCLFYLHERAWAFFGWGIAEIDAHRRSVAKGLSWRFIGSFDTTMISWIVTGHLSSAMKIGGVEMITKVTLYYLHERIWTRISWGQLRIPAAVEAA